MQRLWESCHLEIILYTALFGCQSLVSLLRNAEADTLSRGWEIHVLLPVPITKLLESWTAKLLPLASFTWATSKEPGCLSLSVIIATLPKLAPPQVASVKFDEISNISSLQINLNDVIHLDEEFGVQMVWALWVTRWGIPFVPMKICLTFYNWYLASSGVIWWRAKQSLMS